MQYRGKTLTRKRTDDLISEPFVTLKQSCTISLPLPMHDIPEIFISIYVSLFSLKYALLLQLVY